jgi:hypothetical protein
MAEPSPIGPGVAEVLAALLERDRAELAAAPPPAIAPADLGQLAEDLGLDAGELATLAAGLDDDDQELADLADDPDDPDE